MGETLLLGQKSYVWDNSFKIYLASKYIMQNYEILLILRGHKIPHWKIFDTRCIIVNMKLITFLKFEKNCQLKYTDVCVTIL